MNQQRLMRVWYKTDVSPKSDPDYVGAFSAPFPAENGGRKIVKVDWSEKGTVEVTWLVNL